MARRNALQEIPISVPQTEQQSYDIVSEDEASIPPNKQMSCAERPHSRYISNDESKENITPTQLENIFKEKSQVKVLDSANVGDLPGEGQSSSFTSDSSTGLATGAGETSSLKRETEGSEGELQPRNTPMDFSSVTVDRLGISSESFTTKCAGKSPKTLHKHRRRSTIGVRGSPEMNFLIRQIALQRSNRKSEPEPLANPFTSPRNSILREKISAFRNAFQAVEETEGKLSFPGFSENEELQSEKGKEEVRSEPPEKRKKTCGTTDAGVFSVPHKSPVIICPSQPMESTRILVPEKIMESDCSLASTLSIDVPRRPAEAQNEEAQTLPSSSRSRKRKVMFLSLLSPPEHEEPLPLKADVSCGLKPALKKTPRRDVDSRVGFGEENRVLFSLKESSDNDINSKPEDSIKRSKSVTFGRELSPELFDKTLPANTPLRRGSTPYNHKLGATPSAEQSACLSPCDPMLQPDFDDNDEEDALQPRSLCFDAEYSDVDSPAFSALPEHKWEFSSSEEEEAAVGPNRSTDDTDLVMSSQQIAEEISTTASVSGADLVNESFISSPEVSPAESRKTRSSNKRKVTRNTEETLESNGSKAAGTSKVRSTTKKTRKTVIIKKVQINVPRGKGKKKGRKPKKSIQKPVYSEREAISKRPLLSPILELPECVPTTPASMSHDYPHGNAVNKPLVKVHTQARAVQVPENNIHFTIEGSVERNIEEEDTEKPPEEVQIQDTPDDPALEDVTVSDNGLLEQREDLPALDVAPQNDGVSSECRQSTTAMEVTGRVCKQATSGLGLCSEKEKSKFRNSKRRSSTRKYTSHSSESQPSVTSETTSDCIKQDEVVDPVSHKTSIDGPVQGTIAMSSTSNGLSAESTTTSFSKLPLSSITTENKKSRRSSRIHQVSIMVSQNPEQNTLGENSSAVLPCHSDSSTNDFCLPIDEALQFPQPEKKVRRSMRLRRDSGVIGLSWIPENKGSEMTGRRTSLGSVMRLEKSSALSMENTTGSPIKETLSDYHVPNIARKTRRRTLCTTTIHIQESVSTCDTKRRRSNCFHKAPTADEIVHNTFVPDA
ncbi:cell division cycle-associated protein 2 [Rhinoderma darwinii]|uniref:cell division cycle-associated protein 2 n=1 Tax=Rhinoderma darwinii TaxID=43563 RepID=UPI003F6624A2